MGPTSCSIKMQWGGCHQPEEAFMHIVTQPCSPVTLPIQLEIRNSGRIYTTDTGKH